jgi:hypothetical protein
VVVLGDGDAEFLVVLVLSTVTPRQPDAWAILPATLGSASRVRPRVEGATTQRLGVSLLRTEDAVARVLYSIFLILIFHLVCSVAMARSDGGCPPSPIFPVRLFWPSLIHSVSVSVAVADDGVQLRRSGAPADPLDAPRQGRSYEPAQRQKKS